MNENKLERIRRIFMNYNGVMKTSELTIEKIYYDDIRILLENGVIEKIRRGYYHWCDVMDYGDIMIIKKLYPNAIICNESALIYYDYSNRNPREWHIAIDKNISRNRLKNDYLKIKAKRLDSHTLSVGVDECIINDIKICIYDRDRTICDILKNMNHMDREVFNEAIQRYIADPQKNIVNLLSYAKILRIENKVKNIIGVWL